MKGILLTEESRMVELIFDKNEDWDKRVLCSDEACIGTIGTDGKCKECGKSYSGELRADHSTVNVETIKAEVQQTASATTTNIELDDEWDKRVLCSDGTCIGVIGPDGKCKECGKPQ
jgi:hypothetical protein